MRAKDIASSTARTKPYDSVEDLARRAALNGATMRALADADAFRSLQSDRRDALWAVRRLPDAKPLPLFAAADARELAKEQDPLLPSMSLGEHVAADYQTLRLSLKAHPMAVLRPIFTRERIIPCAEVSALTDGAFARAAGVVLVRQRPGTGQRHFRHARRRNRRPQYRHLGAALRALPPRDDGVTTHAGGRKGAEEPRKCRASDGAAHYRPQPGPH